MTDEVTKGSMPLLAHLDELRKRLMNSIIIISTLAIAAYIFKEQLMSILLSPYQRALGIPLSLSQAGDLESSVRSALQQAMCGNLPCFTLDQIETLARSMRLMLSLTSGLVFIHPFEAFWTFIKFSLYMGLLVGMPLVLIQIWKFVMPALYNKERGYVSIFLLAGSVLFYLGVAFSFLIVLPLSLKFFVGVGQGLLTPMFTFANYISFAMLLLIAFGISFELPLVMVIVVRMGLIKRSTLMTNWRYVIVGAVVLGAIVAPEPFSQMVLAGVFVVLYAIGIIVARFVEPKPADEAEVVGEN
ncbi:twin-arginine translocase subunit TatC [Candidatus Acetothermia bacterium]|nr:twin-arginine translocase subunit TatC [Candidatus Acetothermia bacterium]MBI3643170.1 twin-arginine translocase subunit TatC [Candidatus Acetothermia bacterium]